MARNIIPRASGDRSPIQDKYDRGIRRSYGRRWSEKMKSTTRRAKILSPTMQATPTRPCLIPVIGARLPAHPCGCIGTVKPAPSCEGIGSARGVTLSEACGVFIASRFLPSSICGIVALNLHEIIRTSAKPANLDLCLVVSCAHYRMDKSSKGALTFRNLCSGDCRGAEDYAADNNETSNG